MSAGEEARENAEIFGKKMEDAAKDIGDAFDALRGKAAPEQPTPTPEDDPGTTININVNP